MLGVQDRNHIIQISDMFDTAYRQLFSISFGLYNYANKIIVEWKCNEALLRHKNWKISTKSTHWYFLKHCFS